jgi:hypothetical protein
MVYLTDQYGCCAAQFVERHRKGGDLLAALVIDVKRQCQELGKVASQSALIFCNPDHQHQAITTTA